MPLYSAGRPEEGVTSLQQFCAGDVTLVTHDTGDTELYAETLSGDAPTLTKADCLLIGAALTALGQ